MSAYKVSFKSDATATEIQDDCLLFAFNHAQWYRRKKKLKQRMAIFSRSTAVIFGLSGGLVPLFSPLVPQLDVRIAFPLFGVSAAGALFDKVFGWSRDWAEFMSTATRIEALASSFRVSTLSFAAHTQQNRDVIVDAAIKLVDDVNSIVIGETGVWLEAHSASAAEIARITNGASFEGPGKAAR